MIQRREHHARTRQPCYLSDAWPGFDEAVLDARAQALCLELERLAAGADPVTVGVCWGAGRMRAVTAIGPAVSAAPAPG